uniref:Reverse transcriptase/retrotransposon-derived protein RNase H-like domain-containing protein n=1 Tax=Tanacetum cinerariifolium TaxID=118510 RepID=A0A699GSC4_TANCI|nr:hypothetical protein [Tanacetum cinerariifolium]
MRSFLFLSVAANIVGGRVNFFVAFVGSQTQFGLKVLVSGKRRIINQRAYNEEPAWNNSNDTAKSGEERKSAGALNDTFKQVLYGGFLCSGVTDFLPRNSNCNSRMVGIRNTTIEPVRDANVQSWANNQMNSNMARLREELPATIWNVVSVALSGVSIETRRRNSEGTSRGFFEIDHVSDPHKMYLITVKTKIFVLYCDQKYTPGYLCRGQVFNLEIVVDVFDTCYEEVHLQLVKKKLTRKSPGKLLSIHHNTHIFLDIDKAKKLGCQLCSTCPLQVDIVGGAKLTSTSIPIPIANVLSGFEDVFVVPIALPPMRDFDHEIVLKNNTEPTFSRPYRHPPTQKDAIEGMVKDLMESGDIRPNQSPFSSPVSHVNHLELVLQLLRAHTLFAKQSKYVFGAKRVKYLGHVITGAGVATDESKIMAMKQWPVPSNLKQLRGFLGFTGYYMRFIKGYASYSQPLTNLMKKNAFVWSEDAQSAFLNLKEAMVSALVLKLPNFDEPFVVETDASGEETEVVNRCLECYLKCMTREKPKEWVKWLPLVDYWYNTNFHTSIKTTPFEAVFGQPPSSPILYCPGQSKVDTVDRSLAAREAIIQMLQFHLERAQSRMKDVTDLHRTDRSFEVGPWVWLKLQPHRLVTGAIWMQLLAANVSLFITPAQPSESFQGTKHFHPKSSNTSEMATFSS